MPKFASSFPKLRLLNKKRRPVIGRSIVFLLCFCGLLLAILDWSLGTSRERHLRQTAASTANMARALASHAERSIMLGDAALEEMVERAEHEDGADIRGSRLHQRMQAIVASTPELQELFIYAADGTRLATSLPTLARGNNADREYFIHHATHADRGLHVGQPIRSRSSGILMIPLSRRINRPDGSFGGVAMASLKLSSFGRFYDSFDVGDSGTIILAVDDGTLLYRRPYLESMVGTSIAGGPVYRLYKASGAAGTAMLTARIDGIERMYSYRHLEGYPLIVAIGETKDEILAVWWASALKICGLAAFAMGVLVWGGAHTLRQVRIREQLEDELRRAGAALQQHNVSLKALAESDGLTGLANRRLFDDALARELARARRSGTPFALIMCDVDFFKKFNDRYGHVAGDDCLRRVGGAIAAGVRRPGDLAARYGGEEFAVILPETDLDGARAVAEAIRAAVAELKIGHADNPGGQVSLSLGVVAGPAGAQPDGAWVEAADRQLYEAKAAGRNRVAARLAIA